MKDLNKRKSDISSVQEAIGDLLNSYKLNGKFNEAKLIEGWPKMMGKTIADRTGKIYIKNQVLFVEILSAPLKQKLNHSKTKIMSIFEKELGGKMIDEIIFY